VRELAIGAIQEVDLREVDWLQSAMLTVFDLESKEAAGHLPAFLVGNLAPDALSDFVLLAEAHLDDQPGNAGALILLDLARSTGTRTS
jgi:hypothetical protein